MPVTIGIPIYNAEVTLADAIRSVFAQTYVDWELILVDDGSTDGSLEIARSVIDQRVRVISDGINKKLPARLNQIVDEASYDLICRMDADDLMSPFKIEKQAHLFDNPKTQLVSTGICSLSNDNKPVGYRLGKKVELTMLELIRGHGIAHAPILGRTAWFRQNRYDVSIPRAEDAALWCSAYRAGHLNPEAIGIVEEPLYFFREQHGDLKRILLSHSDLRKLMRRHGPEAFGKKGTLKELARSYLRSLIFLVCLRTGTASLIINRRNQRDPDPTVLERISNEIDLIRSTTVPGLD